MSMASGSAMSREPSPRMQDNAADEFQAADEPGVQGRRGDAETGEEVDDFVDVPEFAPAGLGELPSPVEADEQ